MNAARAVTMVLAALTSVSLLSGCAAKADAEGEAGAEEQLVRVQVLTATRTTLPRTTTQPATVHANYRARMFAKATGYLAKLSADIGQTVNQGDVLGVIDVPELGRQREAQLATIRQMEAEERRSASGVLVAEASLASYRAKQDKVRAEVGKSAATVVAIGVELERVTELVSQRAVADRVLDEVRKRHDAAVAEKVAAEAAVAAAAADLTLAAAQVEAAKADQDVAKALTEVARRRLDELDELVQYTRLTAPFSGVVTQRNVDPGDLVRSVLSGGSKDMEPLFVIAQVDSVRVRVPVPGREAPYANVGDETTVTFQALSGRVFPGTVSRITGELAEQTRTMLVEIDLPNPDGQLRPGMFGQAVITLDPPGNTLTLPAQAVRFDASGASYLYIVNDSNEVEMMSVTTGLDNGEQIEILSDELTVEERVVGPLLQRLHAGQKVDVQQ